MIILGLGNKARNGKDTAGEAIVNYINNQHETQRKHGILKPSYPQAGLFKFATALYKEVEDAIGTWGGDVNKLLEFGFNDSVTGCHQFIPNHVKATPDAKPEPMAKYGKHGQILQWWGTEFRRVQDKDYWVKKTFSGIPANIGVACVTDMRFLNEAGAVKERGGFTVGLTRLNEDGTQYYSNDRPKDHPSETQLDGYNFDYRIFAHNGEVAWVEQQAITLIEYLRGLHV